MIRPTLKSKTLDRHKYSQLLVILLLNFVFLPLFKGSIGETILSLIFVVTIVIIVKTFSIEPKFFRLHTSIALFALAVEVFIAWELFISSRLFVLILVQGIYLIYLSLAIYLILRDILFCQETTIDTIRGGICVYLLTGFVWALMYGIVSSFNRSAFSGFITFEDGFDKIVYFSFTTLTTLGYGDILPVSPFAQMLTNLEAIIGQLYPSILIAILVSDYISKRQKRS